MGQKKSHIRSLLLLLTVPLPTSAIEVNLSLMQSCAAVTASQAHIFQDIFR